MWLNSSAVIGFACHRYALYTRLGTKYLHCLCIPLAHSLALYKTAICRIAIFCCIVIVTLKNYAVMEIQHLVIIRPALLNACKYLPDLFIQLFFLSLRFLSGLVICDLHRCHISISVNADSIL